MPERRLSRPSLVDAASLHSSFALADQPDPCKIVPAFFVIWLAVSVAKTLHFRKCFHELNSSVAALSQDKGGAVFLSEMVL